MVSGWILIMPLNPAVVHAGPEIEYGLQKTADFLRHVLYDPNLELVREAEGWEEVWLLPDNLLATVALEPYYPEISRRIEGSLRRYGYTYSLLHEAILGELIPAPRYSVTKYVIEEGDDYVIWTELCNDTDKEIPFWQEYADRELYVSLILKLYGDPHLESKVLELFNDVKGMWDGTGINDQAVKDRGGLYETYKLALLLYVSRVLDQELEFREKLEEVLWSMQRTDGGFYTYYGSSYLDNKTGVPNAETASLVLIAYKYTPQPRKLDIDELSSLLITYGYTRSPTRIMTIGELSGETIGELLGKIFSQWFALIERYLWPFLSSFPIPIV
ncbi:MAG: hypothetical protein ACE5OY_04820 [Candidatus Bathyarchaeia archaeon]